MFYAFFLALSLSLAHTTSSECYAYEQTTFSVKERYIKTQDAELFSKSMGRGSPLIILHGGAGYLTHDYLLPHLQPLAERNLIIFYDQRGLGRSTGVISPEQINLKTYVEDIESVRKALGVEKVSLLGHSFGSFLGLHYALAHPESIDRLILVSSMPGSSDDLGLFFAELNRRMAPYQKEIQQIQSSDLFHAGEPKTHEKLQKLSFQAYLHNPQLVDKLNIYKTTQANLKANAVWEIFKEHVFTKPYNLLQELVKIQIPVLIIHGDSDVIPFITAEHLHAALPTSKIVKIAQSGHFPFVEQPELFLKAVDSFLN